MSSGERSRLTLDLDSTSEPISGRMLDQGGRSRSFSGWLGLAAALGRALRSEASESMEGPPSSADSDSTDAQGEQDIAQHNIARAKAWWGALPRIQRRQAAGAALRRANLAVVLACSWMIGLPGLASAETSSRQSVDLRFTRSAPGVPTGTIFDIDFVNPGAPSEKPPPVRTVIAEFADGTQVDTSVPERCSASDLELMLLGAEACPTASRVGSGFASVNSGFPGPQPFFQGDALVFNSKDAMVFLFTERSSGGRLVLRASWRGRTSVTEVSLLPGTPPDGGAVDEIRIRVDEISKRVGSARVGFITTPSECPDDRAWKNSAHFTYRDEVSQSVVTRSPCVKGPVRHGLCANDRNGSPRGDHLVGTSAGDRLFGFGGNDRLSGRRGRDCLYGQRGNDLLRGGPGRDRLRGGPGSDLCFGGPGKDRLRGCERTRGA